MKGTTIACLVLLWMFALDVAGTAPIPKIYSRNSMMEASRLKIHKNSHPFNFEGVDFGQRWERSVGNFRQKRFFGTDNPLAVFHTIFDKLKEHFHHFSDSTTDFSTTESDFDHFEDKFEVVVDKVEDFADVAGKLGVPVDLRVNVNGNVGNLLKNLG